MTRSSSPSTMLALLCSLASAAMVPGCSLVVGARQPLTVMASDPKADIYIDGELAGQGTAVRRVRRDEDHAVMVRRGDRASSAHVPTKLSGVGVADIVGCALVLVPCVGLLAPGFRQLATQRVSVVLPPDISGQRLPAETSAAPMPAR